MAEGETDGQTEAVDDATDIFKFGAVGGGAGLLVSYFLPWVDIAGPTAPAQTAPERIALELARGNGGGSISATELNLIPELLAVIGAVAVMLALSRWNGWIQAIAAVLGLISTALSAFLWAFLEGEEGLIEVGNHIGAPTAFEPGYGLIISLLAATLLLVSGSGALVYSYIAVSS